MWFSGIYISYILDNVDNEMTDNSKPVRPPKVSGPTLVISNESLKVKGEKPILTEVQKPKN